jgi:hypothetical protein
MGRFVGVSTLAALHYANPRPVTLNATLRPVTLNLFQGPSRSTALRSECQRHRASRVEETSKWTLKQVQGDGFKKENSD